MRRQNDVSSTIKEIVTDEWEGSEHSKNENV